MFLQRVRLGSIFYLSIALSTAYAQPSDDVSPMLPVQPPTESKPAPPQQRPPLRVVTPIEAERLIGGPTLITLNVTKAQPRQVLEAIVRQAGLKLEPLSADFPKRKWPFINLHCTREPFWSVMQKFSSQVDWTLAYNDNTRLWSVYVPEKSGEVDEPWIRGRAQKVGPYWAYAVSVSTSANLMLYWNLPEVASKGEEQPPRQFANFEFVPDPHLLSFYLVDSTAGLENALDESDQSLLEMNEPARWQFKSEGAWLSASVGLVKRPTSHRLKFIKGNFSTLLALKRQRWEVPVSIEPDGLALANGTRTFQTSQGPMTYHVEMSQHGRDYQATFSRSEDSGWSAPEIRLVDLMRTRILRVYDGQGRELYFNGGGGGGGDAFGMRMQRTDPWGRNEVGLPAKIILDIPTDIRKMVVPFEFRDLPMIP